MVVGELDLLHLGDLADMDHHRQLAMELGDLQRQVGASGEQSSVGIRGVDLGQFGDGQRRQAALVAVAELGHFTRNDSLELGDGLGFAGIELVRLRVAAGLLGGFEDRPVAGAAAEVAGQGFVGLVRVVFGDRAGVLLQGEQAHDEAGGAEAALRTVAVDHRLLDAVQPALVLEVFDADQLLAVQRGDEGQARVEGAIAQAVAQQFADHHGTGATVTGGAAFLGSGLATVFAQILQHRGVGIECAFAAQFSIEKKLDQGEASAVVVLTRKLSLSDFSVN